MVGLLHSKQVAVGSSTRWVEIFIFTFKYIKDQNNGIISNK